MIWRSFSFQYLTMLLLMCFRLIVADYVTYLITSNHHEAAHVYPPHAVNNSHPSCCLLYFSLLFSSFLSSLLSLLFFSIFFSLLFTSLFYLLSLLFSSSLPHYSPLTLSHPFSPFSPFYRFYFHLVWVLLSRAFYFEGKSRPSKVHFYYFHSIKFN